MVGRREGTSRAVDRSGASHARRQSTPRSPRRRSPSIYTTSPTQTIGRYASPDPFTVESVSPHRVLGVDENDELIDGIAETNSSYGEPQHFASMIPGDTSGPPVSSRHTRRTGSRSPRSLRGLASSSVPRGATSRAAPTMRSRASRSALASSSGRSSAPSRGRTLWPLHVRPATLASAC